MEHAVGAVDIGTSGCRAAYLSRKTADVTNIVPVSFPGGPNILDHNEPAEMAIKKIGEKEFIKLFGWEARLVTASHNIIKFPHLKALLDNSDANKPARYIIFINLKALADLGLEMSEDDLLLDLYTHLRKVFREWCDSQSYPQPEEFFFAAPVVKNSSLDANERGVSFDKRRMERLLREADFTKARISTTEAEARLMWILFDYWRQGRDLEGDIALVDAGAGTVQVVSSNIDRENVAKGADLKEIDPPACVGLGGETIYRALSKWMTSNFGNLTSWKLDNARTRFEQAFGRYTVNNPSWEVELVDDPKIVLTGDIMDKEICPLAYGDICKFLEEQMETFKKCGLILIDGGFGNSSYIKSRSKKWPVANKVRFTPSTSRTAIPEGLILLAAGYFTVTLRKVTHSFAIAVELEGGWPDILRCRKKPTEAERALWGGDMKEPDLVAQLIKIKGEEIAVSVEKAKPFPVRRRVCKTDAVLEIAFAMAKAETSNVGKHVLLPFLPLKEFEMLRSLELDLSESFHLPEKPKMLEYDILFFRKDFRTNFILVPTSPWALKAKKEKEIKHFYEDCFEEMIVVNKENDDAAEELTDGTKHLLAEEFSHMPRKNGPIQSFFRGSSVFDENGPASSNGKPSSNGNTSSSSNNPASSNSNPASSNSNPASSNDNPSSSNGKPSSSGNVSSNDNPASSTDEPTSSNDNPASSNDEPTSGNDKSASSNDNSAPNTPDAARTQQQSPSRPDPALESVNSEKAEQSSYFTYPAVGGVPSGKIGAPEFMILRSDDDEVNDMIVDAEFGDLKVDALKNDICMLDTSVWPALVRSDKQNVDLATISVPDGFFDYASAVIPIPTTMDDRVIWAVAIIHEHGRLLENGVAEVPRVFHIFHPTTPDSDDLPEISNIQERLQTFLSAVAQAQQSLEFIAKGGTVTLNVPAETHLHSSGLQVIEFVENFLKIPQIFLNDENARPGLQPGAKRTYIEAKYKTVCENLYKLLRPEVIMPRELVHWRLGLLATEKVYFVSPQCYTDLHNNGDEMNFESARRWTQDEKILDYEFVAFPVLEDDDGDPQWLLAVIREPSRLRSSGKVQDLIIGIDSKDLRWHNVYHQLLSFWVEMMGLPFPRWAKWASKGKKKAQTTTVEGYSVERDVPKQKESLHSPYLLLRNAAELAKDPEGFLGAKGDKRTADDIAPEAIMTEWRRDLEKIMGTSMDSINQSESAVRKRKRSEPHNLGPHEGVSNGKKRFGLF